MSGRELGGGSAVGGRVDCGGRGVWWSVRQRWDVVKGAVPAGEASSELLVVLVMRPTLSYLGALLLGPRHFAVLPWTGNALVFCGYEV